MRRGAGWEPDGGEGGEAGFGSVKKPVKAGEALCVRQVLRMENCSRRGARPSGCVCRVHSPGCARNVRTVCVRGPSAERRGGRLGPTFGRAKQGLYIRVCLLGGMWTAYSERESSLLLGQMRAITWGYTSMQREEDALKQYSWHAPEIEKGGVGSAHLGHLRIDAVWEENDGQHCRSWRTDEELGNASVVCHTGLAS